MQAFEEEFGVKGEWSSLTSKKRQWKLCMLETAFGRRDDLSECHIIELAIDINVIVL